MSEPGSTAPEEARGEKRKIAVALGAIVVLVALLYAPSFGHPFVWDDAVLLLDNPRTTAPSAWSTALGSHYLALIGQGSSPGSYYRPLSLVVLLAEHRLFGDDPTGYRAVHSLLHLLNALLLLLAARHLIRERGHNGAASLFGAGAAAALFLALPYTADAVLFLSNLGDLMALSFILVSVIAFESLRLRGPTWLALCVGIATFAGLASKETAAAIVPVLALQHFLRRARASDRRAALGLVSAGIALAVYLVLRYQALDSDVEIPLAIAAKTFPQVLGMALRWAVAPHPMSLEVDIIRTGALEFTVFGSLGLVGGLVAALALRRRFPSQIVAGLSWLVAVSPSIIATAAVPVFALRYLYVPGAALVLLLAPALATRKRLVRIAVIGMVVGLGLLTTVRVGTWSDPIALWAHEIAQAPERATALSNLAAALEGSRRYEESLEHYAHSAEVAESENRGRLVAMARTDAARILSQRFGRWDEAMSQLARAVDADAEYASAYVEAGVIHAHDGRWKKAEEAFRVGGRLAPWNTDARLGLAGALAAQGRTKEAIAVLGGAREIAAGSPRLLKDIDRRIALVRSHGARPELENMGGK